MGTLLQDLRYGIRMLAKNPGFTAVAVLTLALGIGANTAIFSVVNSVLIRPLPYPDAERLVALTERSRQFPSFSVAYPNFLDWRDQNQVFQQMATVQFWNFNLTGVDVPERIVGKNVSYNLFRTLGVQPVLGRDFAPEDDQASASPVVILSHALWQRRFGADPALLGKTLTLGGRAHTVVGILPPRFTYYESAELFVPIGPLVDDYSLDKRWNHNAMSVLARLKPGVTLVEARAQMETIARRLEQQYPDTNAGESVNVTPLREQISGHVRPALLVLLGAVGFVLLIACVNIANLLLARSATREKEFAIRAALGAGRARVIRQLLTESVVLALLGGALGLLLGVWGREGLTALVPEHLHQVAVGGIETDYRVLGFALLLSLFTGLLFGLAPALRTSRLDLVESLKEGGRTSGAGLGRHRLRNLLVVSEVALALILLISAGLMIRSLHRLFQVKLGIDPENVLTMRVPLSPEHFRDRPVHVIVSRVAAQHQQLLDRIRPLPGVESVGTVFPLPLIGDGWSMPIYFEDRPIPARGEFPQPNVHTCSPDYFRAMRIPLLKGRFFSDSDNNSSPLVAIIGESMARRYWPNEDPIGKRFHLGSPDMDLSSLVSEPWFSVVGIVGDTRHWGLDSAVLPDLYLSAYQFPSDITVVVRTSSDPLGLAAAVREQILAIDKNQPVDNVKTMEQRLSASVAGRRMNMALLGSFAALAIILASVGIYGVMSYSVAQRVHEIGLRMALGARPTDVLKFVVGQGLILTVIGVGIGLAGAFGLTRFLTSMLYEVRPTDPVTFAEVSLLLIGVAVLACYIPARRATKVDPMVALRYE